VSVFGGRVTTVTLLTGSPEGAVLDTKPETGPEGGAVVAVVSTSISSAETVCVRLLGAPASLLGDKGLSPEGDEVSERSGGGISGLRTEGSLGVVIVFSSLKRKATREIII
jgi:hypothetical protein